MIESVENCDKCDLAISCKSVCIVGKGPSNAELMVIGESPGFEDEENRGVFTSKKDKILLSVLEDVIGVDLKTVYFTTLVKCRATDGRKPTQAEADACYVYLEKEIELIKPKAILGLGELVLTTLTKYKGITKKRGEMLNFPINGTTIPFVPTFSPAYISYNESQLKNFALDIEKAVLASTGFQREENKKTRVVLMRTRLDIVQLVEYVKETGVICFDFETSALDTYSLDFYPTMISISFQVGSSYIIPLMHFQSWFTKDEVYEIMHYLDVELFQNPKIKKVNHNIKFDLHVLNWFGISDIRGQISDTMLQHHLIDETIQHGLKELVLNIFPEFAGYEKEVKTKTWTTVPLEILADYAATDSDLTLRLEIMFESILLKDKQLYLLYRNLVIPALRALYCAERDGMPIDIDFLTKGIKEVEDLIVKQELKLRSYKQVKRFEEQERYRINDETIIEIEAKIKKAAERRLSAKKPKTTDSANEVRYKGQIVAIKTGQTKLYEGVNFGSSQQLSKLLYSRSGFSFQQKFDYKKGKESDATGVEVLLTFKDTTGFINDLLLYRSINKMLSTYLIGVRDRVDKNNLIHTSFLQHGTKTGRLSSANPNLQNIPRSAKLKDPIAVETVAKIKKMFVPPNGYLLFQIDYSQAELRIAASFANEDKMLEAYNNDQDLHTVTAASLNNLTLEEFAALPDDVRKDMRSNAKAGNFGLLYGMGAEGFVDYAKNTYGIEMSLEAAKKIHAAFFKAYPNLKAWHAEYIMRAEANGYVRTLFGRKRNLSKILDEDEYIRAMDQRAAINSPIQGTAGEFTVFALALLKDRLHPDVRLGNTVHDSLIYFIPPHLVKESVRIIRETCENLPMEQYFNTTLKRIGMKVDIEVSEKNWKELQTFSE